MAREGLALGHRPGTHSISEALFSFDSSALFNVAGEVAERVGFEPTVPARGTTVFETAPIDHSGTSPHEMCGLVEGGRTIATAGGSCKPYGRTSNAVFGPLRDLAVPIASVA
jgi:hypothetical protein